MLMLARINGLAHNFIPAMKLTDQTGASIKSIGCERLKVGVVELDGNGQPVINPAAQQYYMSTQDMLAAPEGCPITVPPAGRELANFAICRECVYSMITTQ